MQALLLFFIFLTGCTPPVYQGTTYGIDEFIADSNEISIGKFAILELENQDGESCASLDSFDEIVIDGDELTIGLYHPNRNDRVEAFHTINRTTGFRICDGKVYLPGIGSIEAEGLTLPELKKKIQDAFSEQLPDGRLFVDFKKRRQRSVQIIGAENPMVAVNGRIHLNEVLAKAGLNPSTNLFKSYVMREGRQLPVDLYKLIHEGDQTQNIAMRGGDQIFLSSGADAAIMVTGEVLKPLVIPVPYGSISLREALAKAGGIPFTGDQGCIGVVRGDFIRPKVYSLNWTDLKMLPNHSLLLMPGDVVVISERPITQWNRFIDQVQPSGSCMQTAYDIYSLINQ